LPNSVDVSYWRMGGITVTAVEDYLYNMLPPRDEVLAEMEAEAGKNKIPIVGPAVARIFFQLATMIHAKTVFEMGSAIGYSTIWWARAIADGGRVIYTDGDPKNAEKARGYFQRAELPTASLSRPAMPSSFSRKKNKSLTSSLTTSIKTTIRACCVSPHRACVRADCL
jgi:hypothetical protein